MTTVCFTGTGAPLLNVQDLTKSEAAGLLKLIHDATLCTDSGQLGALIGSLRDLLPLEGAGALLCRASDNGHPQSVVCLNMSLPESFVAEYFARNYVGADPVVRDSMGIAHLCFWQDSFAKYGRPEGLLGLARDFGLRLSAEGHGYAHGLTNFSATEQGMISFFGLPRSQRTETILSLLVPCLQEAMKASWKPAPGPCRLTPREREILKWCAAGKSSWDLSAILHISERTVKYHMDNVMRKLDAVNRTHAVAIALRERLIPFD
jgi:DNA-binding CsgD family transcriptional regulator